MTKALSSPSTIPSSPETAVAALRIAPEATLRLVNLVGQNGSANGCAMGGTDIVLVGAIGTALDTNLVAQEGAVPYHALVLGGPAIDAIPLGAHCTPPSYDQRNLARPLDGNADGAPACDIGAYEAPAPWSIFLPLVRK